VNYSFCRCIVFWPKLILLSVFIHMFKLYYDKMFLMKELSCKLVCYLGILGAQQQNLDAQQVKDDFISLGNNRNMLLKLFTSIRFYKVIAFLHHGEVKLPNSFCLVSA